MKAMTAVSLFDARSLKKPLLHGVRHGIIPPEKVALINADAPNPRIDKACDGRFSWAACCSHWPRP